MIKQSSGKGEGSRVGQRGWAGRVTGPGVVNWVAAHTPRPAHAPEPEHSALVGLPSGVSPLPG